MGVSSLEKNLDPKNVLGEWAASLVLEGMCVGLGSGTTASAFVRALGRRCREGLNIQGIATSQATEDLAKEEKIPLLSFDSMHRIDLTVDGADLVFPDNTLVKGLGGALLREKAIAEASGTVVILVEEKKLLKKKPETLLVPVEIIPFCLKHILFFLMEMKGWKAKVRTQSDGKPFVTDNNNYVIDVEINPFLGDVKGVHRFLKERVGVVETGIFFSKAQCVAVADKKGCLSFDSQSIKRLSGHIKK